MDIHIVYNLSDIDHLRDITDEAYLYYLPAFLIGTLLYPDRWIYYSFPLEKISDLLSHFSSKQLDALIAFIDFHVHKLMERASDFLEFGEDLYLEDIEKNATNIRTYTH